MMSASGQIAVPIVATMGTTRLEHSQSEPVMPMQTLSSEPESKLSHSASSPSFPSKLSPTHSGSDQQSLFQLDRALVQPFVDFETVAHSFAYNIKTVNCKKFRTIMFDKKHVPTGLMGGINWDKGKPEITIFFRGTKTVGGVWRDTHAEAGDASFWEQNTQEYIKTVINDAVIQAVEYIANEKKCDPKDVAITVNITGHSLGAADAQNCTAALIGHINEYTSERKIDVVGKQCFTNIKTIKLAPLNPPGVSKDVSAQAIEWLKRINAIRASQLTKETKDSSELKTNPLEVSCYWVYGENDPVSLSGSTSLFANEHTLVKHHMLYISYANRSNKPAGWVQWLASWFFDVDSAHAAHCNKFAVPDTDIAKWQYADSSMPEGRAFIDLILNYKSGILQSIPVAAAKATMAFIMSWTVLRQRVTLSVDPEHAAYVHPHPAELIELEDAEGLTEAQQIKKLAAVVEEKEQKVTTEIHALKEIGIGKIEDMKNGLEEKVDDKVAALKKLGEQKLAEVVTALQESDKAIANLVDKEHIIYAQKIEALKAVFTAKFAEQGRQLNELNEKNAALKAELAEQDKAQKHHLAREKAKSDAENIQLKVKIAYKGYSHRVTALASAKENAMWTAGISTTMVCVGGALGLAGQYVSGLSISAVAAYFSGITASTIALAASAMMIGAAVLAVTALCFLAYSIHKIIQYNKAIYKFIGKEFVKRGQYLSSTVDLWEMSLENKQSAMKSSPVMESKHVHFAEDSVRESKRSTKVAKEVEDKLENNVKDELVAWIRELEDKLKALKCSRYTHKALYKHVQENLGKSMVITQPSADALKASISTEAQRLLSEEIQNNHSGFGFWKKPADRTVNDLMTFFTIVTAKIPQQVRAPQA